MCKSLIYKINLVLIFPIFVYCIEPPIMPNLDLLNVKPKVEGLNKIALKGKPVPPCIACQSLVNSFLAAVAKTTRQSFAGGDADWEKNKLGAYENSELRFIEIQEMLCVDVELGKDQCYKLAEDYESELEDWFYEERKKNVDLHESLCINHVKVCCPNNTYGPNCIPCPGGIEKPCSGHGKCRKGGTREEPANCVCDAGYAGEVCTECDKGYYSDSVSSSLSCQKCDTACKSHCRGPGPKNCEVCAHGYHFSPDKGCVEFSHQSQASDSSNNELENVEMAEDGEKTRNSSNDFTNDEDQLQLKPNIEDSTLSTAHSEL